MSESLNKMKISLITSISLSILLFTTSAYAQRVALLIGNANYGVGRLTNPPNDVAAMESALNKLGFKVEKVLNANQNQMKRAVRDFGSSARGAEVAFIYYSGHGTQAQGENYLLPIGATIDKDSDYGIEAVSANDILRQIRDAQPRAAILVLDACRDNPLAATTRSSTKGLGRMDAPTGTMIAFATAPNTTASDNGDYAKVLAREMQKPGQELIDVFRNTTSEVRRLSGGKQEPRISEMSIVDRIYLAGTGTQIASVTPTPAGQPPTADGDQEAWELAKRRDTTLSYQAYLDAYPNGRYAATAQVALKGLAPSTSQVSTNPDNADGTVSKSMIASMEKVIFSADDKTMATTNWGTAINLWNTTTFRVKTSIELYTRDFDFNLSSDGQTLAVFKYNDEKGVQLYDTSTGKKTRYLSTPSDNKLGSPKNISTILDNFNHDPSNDLIDKGRLKIALQNLGKDWLLEIKDTTTGQTIAKEKGVDGPPIYSSSLKRTVFIVNGSSPRAFTFDFTSQRIKPIITWASKHRFNAFSLYSNATYVAGSESTEKEFGLYDVEKNQRLYSFPNGTDPYSINVQNTLLSYVHCSDGDTNCRAEVVDLSTNRKHATFRVFGSGIRSTWISPLGKYVIADSQDSGSTKIWNLAQNRQVGPNYPNIADALNQAKNGNPDAQFYIGTMHIYGFELEGNPETAARWYQAAAKQGYAEAQNALGLLYQNGEGVKKDQEQALRWIRSAADQGHAESQFNLGHMYQEGIGTKRNLIESTLWYQKAANQRHDRAILALEKLKKQ